MRGLVFIDRYAFRQIRSFFITSGAETSSNIMCQGYEHYLKMGNLSFSIRNALGVLLIAFILVQLP